MGSQTMFSSNNGGGGGGGGASGLASYSPIARQPSLYSSTLEEYQNAMHEPGKRYGSMNVEEFLKNIWSAEDSQAASTTTTEIGYGDQQRHNRVVLARSVNGNMDPFRNVERQPPDAISTNRLNKPSSPLPSPVQQKRQDPSASKITLADYMHRNGLSREEADGVVPGTSSANPRKILSTVNTSLEMCNPMPSNNTTLTATGSAMIDNLAPQRIQPDWINLAINKQPQRFPSTGKRGFTPSPIVLPSGNSMFDGVTEGPNYGAMNALSISQSNLTASPGASDYVMHGKKRTATDAIIERSAERRQRRMIKNRESAARSRARKQAYTVELETEVKQLQEENARLRKQQALIHQLPDSAQTEQSGIRVLRRTRSW